MRNLAKTREVCAECFVMVEQCKYLDWTFFGSLSVTCYEKNVL